MFTSLRKLVLLSFYRLSDLEFHSLIHLGNYFNCLLVLLMHIRSKIQSRTEQSRMKSGKHSHLLGILNDLCVVAEL